MEHREWQGADGTKSYLHSSSSSEGVSSNEPASDMDAVSEVSKLQVYFGAVLAKTWCQVYRLLSKAVEELENQSIVESNLWWQRGAGFVVWFVVIPTVVFACIWVARDRLAEKEVCCTMGVFFPAEYTTHNCVLSSLGLAPCQVIQ